MDKFILAESPYHPERSGLFIIHLKNPIAIIRCTEGHLKIDQVYDHFQFENSDKEIEEWTLSAFHFFTADFISDPGAQVKPLLKRAWRWYRAYMEWEDNNIDNI